MEEEIFKPASQEELDARAQMADERWVVELIPHEPFLAIHPLGKVTVEKSEELAEQLSTSDSSWIVVTKPELKAYIDKLNALNI
jgi:hypothetical protein